MSHQSRLRKVVILNSLAPILVIAIILVIALRLQQEVTAAQSAVTRTLGVETEIEAITDGLLSAESSLRAFVLTNSATEFDLYQQNFTALPAKLCALQSHVNGDPSQSVRAANLVQLATRRLQLLEQVAKLAQVHPEQAAKLAPVNIDPPAVIAQGRALMEQVNAEADAMMRIEDQGLARRSNDLQHVRTIFTAALWTALGALLICGLRVCLYVHLRVIRRLETLTLDVEAYGSKSQPIPPDDSVPDEIGALRRVFCETANHLSAERERMVQTLGALQLQTDRAEAALASKSDFLACMSHEIRTPMTGVIGLVDLTLRAQDLPQTHRLTIEEIRKSSLVLLSLIKDILDFSKIESGKMQLDLVPCDLAELLHSTADLFRPQSMEKQVALEVEISARLDCNIIADPTRLRQIVSNLISNAIKFTESGFVRVSLRPSSTAPESFELIVHDTGIGIAPEFRKQLFQPFSQADLSTTRTFGGTGLGLSIVKRLVDLMGGQIVLESQPGLGSRFILTLPLRKNRGTSAIPCLQLGDTSRIASLRSKKVLLAEDNATNQLVVKKILSSAGLAVTAVDNGEEAVAALQNEPFDLILMDCRMPKMDGYQASRQIRALTNGHAAVPIIALTANAFKADEDLCRQSGMNDFLSKPFNLDTLVDKCLFWIGTGAANGASDLSRELRLIFLAEYPARFNQLLTALRKKDYKEIVDTSHWLRGGSSSFFTTPFTARLLQLELDARQQRCQASDKDIEELTLLFETTCSSLRSSAASVG